MNPDASRAWICFARSKRARQSLGDLGSERCDLVRRERTAVEQIAQGASIHQFHDDEVEVALAAQLVNLRDMGVVERRG